MNYKLTMLSQTELSHWELSHIINVFGNTYMKLTMLYEMQKLYDSGAADNDFILGSSSLELHTNINELNTPVRFSNANEYTTIDRKSNDAASFWELFHKLHRPIIFYRTDNGYQSLYSFQNAIIFSAIETNSPQRFKVNGKAIVIELSKMIMSSIVGYETLNLVYGNETARLLEQNNQQIIINQESIAENRELILRGQSIEQKQIDTLKEDNERILKQLNQVYMHEHIEYEPFIEEQINIIKGRFNKQLDEVKFIVKDFENA